MNTIDTMTEKVETFRGVKAFKLLEDGRLQTGDVAGSLKTFFEEGKTYSVSDENEIKLCSHGFHFYKTKNACFGADLFQENTVFHEITAYGNVISDTQKCVAKTIKIGKKISPIFDENNNSGDSNSGDNNSGNFNSGFRNSGGHNSGNYNSGFRNSGYSNSGDFNSGYSNSGNSNSGDFNSGNSNSGARNSGKWNTGDNNTGYWNSGDHNSGDNNSGRYNSGKWNTGHSNSGDHNSGDNNSGSYNSGNYNTGNRNTGFFNTKNIETINIFDKPCELEIWKAAKKPDFLSFNMNLNKTYKEAFQKSWKNTTEDDRKLVEKLPNFNWEIFTEISGITKPIEWK